LKPGDVEQMVQGEAKMQELMSSMWNDDIITLSEHKSSEQGSASKT